MRAEIPIPTKRLDEFCRRWKIAELRVFGSALREDFSPDSYLDLLVRFAPDAEWSNCEYPRELRPNSGLG
jgi:predicted nucleotidyltransferase